MLQDTAGAGDPVLWHVRTTGAILVTVKAVWSSAMVGGTKTQEKCLLRHRGDRGQGAMGPRGQDCHEGRLRHEGAQVILAHSADILGT